jgi:XTP/dITP diphosphohydrolase
VTLRFVLATANRHKAAEITEVLALSALGGRIELVPRPSEVPEVDETGTTLLDNARLKAQALADATGLPALADDTGLEVEGLDGAPGVYSARFAGPGASYADNVAKLLEALQGGKGRRACFRTVAVALWPDGAELVAEGAVNGVIADAPAGGGGFGYDPVFVPDGGGGRTFAQLAEESGQAKHRLSHRGRAFTDLAAQIANSMALGRP